MVRLQVQLLSMVNWLVHINYGNNQAAIDHLGALLGTMCSVALHCTMEWLCAIQDASYIIGQAGITDTQLFIHSNQ